MKTSIRRVIVVVILVTVLWTGGYSISVAQTPAAQQILFSDDFEKGLAGPWDWETGWGIETSGGNHVLHGKGHIWMRLFPKEDLGEIDSFESRINLSAGSMHVNYRIDAMGNRYFVRLEEGRLSLFKMARSQTQPTELVSKPFTFSFGAWHALKFTGAGNRLQVFIDNQLQLDYTDSKDPFLTGWVAFESLDGGDVRVDDVVLKGRPPAPVPANLTWNFTGGPRGGIGYDIRISPADTNTIWVTDAFAGAHQSNDGGKTWTARNKGIDARSGMSGDAVPVFSLAIDPRNAQVVFAGVQGIRGLYKSSDGGQSWVRKDNGIQDKPQMEIRGITFDPSDSNLLYCSGNYLADEATIKQRGFIYQSKDGGENWKLLIEPDALVRWVIVDPVDPQIVYASTGIFDRFAVKPSGVLKSIDRGKTWKPVNDGFTSLAVGALAMHPTDHLTLIAGTGKASAFADEPNEVFGGVFITHDGGGSWKQIDPIRAHGDITLSFSAVAFAPSNPNIHYADSGNQFFRSEDGGETWARYGVEPNGKTGMLENRGQPIALAVHPNDPNTIFMNAYDGGVFVSVDGGKTWRDSSSGYAGSQVWGIAIDPKNPAYVVAVSKNGIHLSENAGSAWQGRISDPAVQNMEAVAVDPADRQHILIGRSITGEVYQTKDGGLNWRLVLGPFGKDEFGKRQAVHKIVFASSAPGTVYVAAGVETLSPVGATRDTPGAGIYKSTDGGSTWVAMNTGLENTTHSVMAIAVHPQNPDVLYLGEMNNGVFKSVDGGKTWKAANANLKTAEVRALAIDPFNPETVYAGVELGGVWKSDNGGATWRNISAGMQPESSVRSLVVDPSHTGTLFAADTQTGVYRSSDGGASWQPLKYGLKVKAIHALTISADGQTLYAATEGNGVYRLDLSGQPPQPIPQPTPTRPAPSSIAPPAPAPSVTPEAARPTVTSVPTAPLPPGAAGSPGILIGLVSGGVVLVGLLVFLLLRKKPTK